MKALHKTNYFSFTQTSKMASSAGSQGSCLCQHHPGTRVPSVVLLHLPSTCSLLCRLETGSSHSPVFPPSEKKTKGTSPTKEKREGQQAAVKDLVYIMLISHCQELIDVATPCLPEVREMQGLPGEHKSISNLEGSIMKKEEGKNEYYRQLAFCTMIFQH